MSSKSFINVCSALTLSRFIAEVVLKDCPEDDKGNRKVRRLCGRIVDYVHTARDLWPECDSRDLEQITKRLGFLGDTILGGQRNITELCAVTLALLCDMEPRLRGSRQSAVIRIIELMESLNREFDRSLDEHDAYDYASHAADSWYGHIGM